MQASHIFSRMFFSLALVAGRELLVPAVPSWALQAVVGFYLSLRDALVVAAGYLPPLQRHREGRCPGMARLRSCPFPHARCHQ